MKNSTTSILSVLVDCITIEEVLEKIKRSLSGKPRILAIVSINPEIVMLAREQPTFKTIINNAYLRLPDGIGIILAARVLGLPKLTRITGNSLMKKLTAGACDWNVSIGLIGGRPKVAIRAGDCLFKANPALHWWAEKGPTIRMTNDKPAVPSGRLQMINETQAQNSKSELLNYSYPAKPWRSGTITQFLHPNSESQSYDFIELIEKINRTRTSILFCAFGAPKQEFFVEELKKYENKLKQPLITVSVGGAFDELAGMVSPVPAWIETIGLKWFWRLIHEPWRWRRQLRLLKFLYLVLTS